LRRRRRSSKKAKRTTKKKSMRRPKSKKMRGGVTVRAQDLTRLPSDVLGEIREMHPLLTPKLTNVTLIHAVKDYLKGNSRSRMYVVHKYGEINNWDVSNVTNMTSIFEDAHFFNQPLNKWNVSNVTNMYRMFDARSRRRAGRAVPRGASERPARGGENCLASSGGGVRAARRV